MICYRDRTYCPFATDCAKGQTCPEALTDEIEMDARFVGLPIATYKDTPDCFEEATNDT